jgi:hypothetical protein
MKLEFHPEAETEASAATKQHLTCSMLSRLFILIFQQTAFGSCSNLN